MFDNNKKYANKKLKFQQYYYFRSNLKSSVFFKLNGCLNSKVITRNYKGPDESKLLTEISNLRYLIIITKDCQYKG